MNPIVMPSPAAPYPVSPLILSDRLIALAQAADRAGFTATADRLVTLACSVFDEEPKQNCCKNGGRDRD